MKLHFLPPSANSHGCIAVVKHLKLEESTDESKKIVLENCYGKTRSEEFLKMNPCHCAPTIEINETTAIWESGAIMRYLCNVADDDKGLYSKDDLVKKGKIDMCLDWRQTSLYPCLPNIGYVIFGLPVGNDDEVRESFKKLKEEHFPVLCDVYLKDTKFCFSDTPTIADLAIAPPLTFIKARSKFWDAVPEKVKEYHANVLAAFPDTKEYFDALDGMATGFNGDGHDLSPEA